MYIEGKYDDDVEEPLKEAVKWFSMSAANFNPEALNKLGVMYRDGVGLKQDFELARQFLNLSIQYGSFNAVSDLIKLQVMEMKKISSQENVLNENVDIISAGMNKNTDKQNLRQFPNEERSPKEANDFEKVTWKHDFNANPSHKKC
jgi:TPR repeat protein